MAVQTLKSGQSLTIPATEDELILLPPFNFFNQEVRFTNVSGTSKFGIGGPVFSDTSATAYTTAGTVVRLNLDFVKQGDPSSVQSVHRIHCSGVGVWKVEY
jgi:hypothetical protein